MLNLINLYVIDKIFSESEYKISTNSKMLYINCLIHHFRDKKPTVSNAVAFEIFISDIPNYEKYDKQFQELHKANLIVIGLKSIVFNNTWGKHIDRSKLDKVNPMEYVAGFSFQGIEAFQKELYDNDSLFELCEMRYKINKVQTKKLMELFIKEQVTFKKTYNNFSDCIKHFTMWVGKNLDKAPKDTVKSQGKILGI